MHPGTNTGALRLMKERARLETASPPLNFLPPEIISLFLSCGPQYSFFSPPERYDPFPQHALEASLEISLFKALEISGPFCPRSHFLFYNTHFPARVVRWNVPHYLQEVGDGVLPPSPFCGFLHCGPLPPFHPSAEVSFFSYRAMFKGPCSPPSMYSNPLPRE